MDDEPVEKGRDKIEDAKASWGGNQALVELGNVTQRLQVQGMRDE